MAKFRVSVTSTSYGSVIVSATCEDEARKKADKAYYDGTVVWASVSHDLHDVVEETPYMQGNKESG